MIIPNPQLLIEHYGLVSIFALMFGESAFVPFPSEITMTFAGYLAGRDVMDFWQVVLAGTLGNTLGASFSYFVGRTLGVRATKKAIHKWGHYVLIKEKEFERASTWFKKFGPRIVFYGRLLPVVRAFVSLPAGIAKMNFFHFILYTFLGSFLWVLTLAFVGLKLGDNWESIEPYFHSLKNIIFLGLAFGVVWIVIKVLRRR